MRAAILAKTALGFLFLRVIQGEMGRDRVRRGLRTASASAVGQWAFGRAEGMRMSTTRDDDCAAGVRLDATADVGPSYVVRRCGSSRQQADVEANGRGDAHAWVRCRLQNGGRMVFRDARKLREPFLAVK